MVWWGDEWGGGGGVADDEEYLEVVSLGAIVYTFLYVCSSVSKCYLVSQTAEITT